MQSAYTLSLPRRVSILRKRRTRRLAALEKKWRSCLTLLGKNVKAQCTVWPRGVKGLCSVASTKTPSPEEAHRSVPGRSTFYSKRLRVVDVIRQRRTSRKPAFVKTITPYSQSDEDERFWNIVFPSVLASGLYCGNQLTKIFSKAAIFTCSPNWPVCISVGAGILFFVQAQIAHQRVLQARNLWTKTLAKAEDLMRMGAITLTTTLDQRRFGKWIIVFLFSLTGNLTNNGVVHDYLCSSLTPAEFFVVAENKDRTTLALQVLTDLVQQQSVEIYLAASMNTTINALSTYSSTLSCLLQELKLDLTGRLSEEALRVCLAAFAATSVGSVGLWGIPLTAAFAFTLSTAHSRQETDSQPLRFLHLEADCLSLKETIDQIHLNQAQTRRIVMDRGFGSGSNVIPADGLTGEYGSNKPHF